MFIVDENGTLIYKFNGKEVGQIVREVDGYYYWWPGIHLGGIWDENALREIADILKVMNADWDEEVRKEFEGND